MTTFGWILLGLCIVLVILFGVRILSDLMWNNRLKHFQRRNHVFFPKVTQLFWFKRVYGFTVVILLTFAVLATGAFEINNMMGERKLLNAIPVSSEQNLKQIIKNANSQSWLESIFSFFPSGARNDDAIDFLEAESQVTAKDIIGTNLQKEGVDEADVIKTDGDMVYYAPRYDNSIRIFYVQMDKTLDLIGNLNLENLYTDALYLTSDYLIVVGYTYETINYQVESGFYSYGWNWSYTGAVRIYDRATLEVTHELQTDGMFYEHRVIGDAMYLVSQKSVYDDEPRPMFQKTDGDSTVTSYLDFDDIYYFNNMHISSMTVVTALNLSTFESQSQAFLGGVSHLYADEDSIYTAYNYYEQTFTTTKSVTQIIKYDLDVENVEISYVSQKKITGFVNSQFWMDEHESHMRVVTTAFLSWDSVQNTLYVLKDNENDDEMDIVGILNQGLGKPGESVKSVRFSGHFAYVVTFRQIDPLYTIDISEPTLPIITNEIEEEGYSTYLHVWDQHHLIGLGLSADPFGMVTGMKLSAYSDDDKTEPLTTFFINDLDEDGKYSYGYSEAIHNHKAIMVSPSHGIFAFPVMVWHYWYESGQYHYGYLSYYMVFFIDFEATEPSDIISNPIIIEHDMSETYNQVDRGIYIDGIVYTFSFHQMVSYDLETDTVFENYFYDE